MKREKLSELIRWKDSSSRKPLIIRGARQVGKTWLMKEFGKNNYERTVYINLEKDKHLHSLFREDFDIKRLLMALKAVSGEEIEPGNTLLIVDEIQEVPEAITALKYFREDANEFHIMAAGSLLGVALHSNTSFPVGKVDFMDLYPMSFPEFLVATGEAPLAEIMAGGDWKLIRAFRTRFIERLRQYYYVGGMPEAVSTFVSNNDYKAVREVQQQILDAYELDFSKHAPADIVPRIRMLWNSIPAQLAKENRKFIYGLVKEGSRARDYEIALSWLTDCGQVHKISRVTRPGLPLKAYHDMKAFKLFAVDTGLLTAMNSLEANTLLQGNAVFTEFRGALTEQFVFQQLKSMDVSAICYWSASRSTAEVDFVIQYRDKIIPLEVKAEENLQAKSLRAYSEKFTPPLSIRLSMSDYRMQDWMVNIPLYAVSKLGEVIGRQLAVSSEF